jgi:hypothetical protein
LEPHQKFLLVQKPKMSRVAPRYVRSNSSFYKKAE